MKELLTVDDALVQRLTRDCAMHETLVREVVNAHTNGQLEADVALRSLALELHSVKGLASVLGNNTILTMIGSLGEAMLHRTTVSHREFWGDFAGWFASLVSCLQDGISRPPDKFALEIMSARRDELLKSLGEVRDMRALRAALAPAGKLTPSAGRRILLVDDSATVRVAMTARLVDRGYPAILNREVAPLDAGVRHDDAAANDDGHTTACASSSRNASPTASAAATSPSSTVSSG